MFGPNAKDGSVGKISENPFARADLENIHLMIDDDMRLEALKQTNYIKAIVTAKGKMDLERKGKQSYLTSPLSFNSTSRSVPLRCLSSTFSRISSLKEVGRSSTDFLSIA